MNCQHDWRVDPTRITSSNPPLFYVTCADCGAVENRRTASFGHRIDVTNPKTWATA